MTKSGNSPDYKEKIRIKRQKMKQDKLKRKNPLAKELAEDKYRQRIVETKEKGGSKNLLKDIYNLEGD